MSEPHIVITGLMGVGKSTTASALAAELGWPERDSDRDIETLFGRSGGDLAAEVGVEALHQVEAGVLLGALAVSTPTVISAAASVVEHRLCRDALARRALVIVLHAPVEQIHERALSGSHRRMIGIPEMQAIADRRGPLFESVADAIVDATRATANIVAEVLAVAR